MLLPGHLAGGYIATKTLLHLGHFSLSIHEANLVMATGMIASVAPDIDFVYFFFKNKSLKLQEDSSHRTLINHSPIIWLVTGIIIFALAPSDFWKAKGPEEKSLSIFYWKYFWEIYTKNLTFWAEICVIAIAIFILSK